MPKKIDAMVRERLCSTRRRRFLLLCRPEPITSSMVKGPVSVLLTGPLF